jgi:hypothetical protein
MKRELEEKEASTHMSRRIQASHPEDEMYTQLAFRVTAEQRRAIEEAAKRSGWGVSEQIRFELFEPRGMWRKEYGPYRPYKVVQDSSKDTPSVAPL